MFSNTLPLNNLHQSNIIDLRKQKKTINNKLNKKNLFVVESQKHFFPIFRNSPQLLKNASQRLFSLVDSEINIKEQQSSIISEQQSNTTKLLSSHICKTTQLFAQNLLQESLDIKNDNEIFISNLNSNHQIDSKTTTGSLFLEDFVTTFSEVEESGKSIRIKNNLKSFIAESCLEKKKVEPASIFLIKSTKNAVAECCASFGENIHDSLPFIDSPTASLNSVNKESSILDINSSIFEYARLDMPARPSKALDNTHLNFSLNKEKIEVKFFYFIIVS